MNGSESIQAAKTPRFVGLGVIALAFLAVGCQPRDVVRLPKVSLRMHGAPADAVVIIDEEPVGTLELVQARGVALPVGLHHITVKAQGFFPWDREVRAEEGQPPIRLDVALTPVPD
jgi:hypothetical protein